MADKTLELRKSKNKLSLKFTRIVGDGRLTIQYVVIPTQEMGGLEEEDID